MKIRAHGFNQRPRVEQVVGYLEWKEPLPLDQPDRKATSFVTSHFYLDDFAQSSKGPNPQDAAEYVRLNVLPRPGQPQPCCLPPGLHPGSGAHRRPPFLPSGWAAWRLEMCPEVKLRGTVKYILAVLQAPWSPTKLPYKAS